MKTIFALLILMIVRLHAETGDARFTKGTTAYASGDFAEAVDQFRRLGEERNVSAAALHNLGNAEWKVSRPGYAVLAWERARALDPFNVNTAANLRFARSKAHIEAPTTAWLVAASLALWGGVILLTGPRLLGWRRADWHQGVAALLLAIFLFTLPALLGISRRAQLGVVLEDETPLRLTPTREAETLVKLTGGEVARVENERGDYLYVRADGDRAGWVLRKDFARVWQ